MRWFVIALLAAGCTGTIGGPSEDDGDGGSLGPDAGASPVDAVNVPRTVEVEGPAILPHVQAFANAVCTDVSACTISTYVGHSPVASRALDILASEVYGERPADDNVLGDAAAAYALEHMDEMGVTYVIWRQRYNDGSGWDPMEDRGNITQNHYDHVHVSFDATL